MSKRRGPKRHLSSYDEAFVTDGDRQALDFDDGAYDEPEPWDGRPVDKQQVLAELDGFSARIGLAYRYGDYANDEALELARRTLECCRALRRVIDDIVEERSSDLRRLEVEMGLASSFDPSEPSEAERQADRLAGRDPQ